MEEGGDENLGGGDSSGGGDDWRDPPSPRLRRAGGGQVAAVHGDDSEKQKQALVDMENQWLHSENDPEALEKILAEDFVHALPIGFIYKEGHIGYVRRMRSHMAEEKKHFEELRTRVYGTVGIVNGIVVAEKEGAAARRTVFTDVFVLREGRWQAVNRQENLFEAHANSPPRSQ
jgi:hypothetical protein